MAPTLKSTLRYLGMLVLAAGLVWLSLRGIPDVEGESKAVFLWQTWARSNKWYLMVMAGAAMLSHVLRAYRWKMLLAPTGNQVTLGNSFLSLMVGYLVNLAVPRGGEVSRCYNLLKLQQTPVEVSFGTVVAERVVDVLCLIALIAISFFVEWDKLMAFMGALPMSSGGGLLKGLAIGGMALAALVVAFFMVKKNEKVRKIVAGFKEGLLAVFRLKHNFTFAIISILIWLLYFVMSYLVIVAFPETKGLGLSAVLTLFAMGAIAMAVPLPGGAGSYHTIVPIGLVMLYGLPQGDAIAFVFIFHAWQTFIMIVGGLLSLLVSYWMIQWRK